MASRTSPFVAALRQDSPDFSLVLGGPLYQLLRRAHMAGNALELMRRRVVVISLFAWVPLLVLSVLEGRALGGVWRCPSCGTGTLTLAFWWRCRCSSWRSWWFTSACAWW